MKTAAFALILLAAWTAPGEGYAAEVVTYQVTLNDGRIIPEALQVPAGKKIKLILRNDGRGPAEFESEDLRVEKVLGPGVSSFVVIHPPQPGRYRFFDEFHPGGAQLILTVK